jgi:hypothetical protein
MRSDRRSTMNPPNRPAFLFALNLLSVSLLATAASAKGLDYSVDSFARTSSLGLSASPNVGYSFLLWGDPSSPLHGYIRPNVTASFTPATISGRAELELHPVTFLGLTAGRTWTRRFSNLPGQDCNLGACIGNLGSTDVGAKALFKYGIAFGSLKYTKTFVDSFDDRSRGIIDPGSALLLSPGGEVVSQWNAVVGVPIHTDWSVGGIYQKTDLKNNPGTQNAEYAFLRLKRGDLTYLAGAGRFESQLKPAGPSFILSVSWSPFASP